MPDRTPPLDPALFAGAFAYEHTDVPPGMTLQAWRVERRARRSLRRWRWPRLHGRAEDSAVRTHTIARSGERSPPMRSTRSTHELGVTGVVVVRLMCREGVPGLHG
jgi:hypothetical protein